MAQIADSGLIDMQMVLETGGHRGITAEAGFGVTLVVFLKSDWG